VTNAIQKNGSFELKVRRLRASNPRQMNGVRDKWIGSERHKIIVLYTRKHIHTLHRTYNLLCGARDNDNELAIYVRFNCV
jgi:hypothetical protein